MSGHRHGTGRDNSTERNLIMARKGGVDRGITQRASRDGWWVRLYVHGRERWHKCDTKSQARALYGRLKAEIREGTYFPERFTHKQDITLRAWIQRYVESSTTRNLDNEQRYGRRWQFYLGKRLLHDVTTEDLRRLQAKMKAKGKWSDATINRHFSFLRRVLMVAIKDGKLTRNPVSAIRFLPEEHRTRFLTDQELMQVRQHVGAPYWQVIAFAVETGMRRAEQFGLRWNQVNLEAGLLTIPLSKSGKSRHVPLSDTALQIVRSLDSFTSSPWVFPSPKNPLRPWNAQSFVNHVFTPALANAGIHGACWHTLRHTAASRRVMAGVDLVSVQKILGHLDIQTTLRYAHLSPGHLREAVNRGSLTETVTQTVTTVNHADPTSSEVSPQRSGFVGK